MGIGLSDGELRHQPWRASKAGSVVDDPGHIIRAHLPHTHERHDRI